MQPPRRSLWASRGLGSPYRRWKSLEYLLTRDRSDLWRYLAADLPVGRSDRLRLVRQYLTITDQVRGYHTLGEMLRIAAAILARAGRRNLTVVEAGCAHGSSTAKLSLAVRRAGGHLLAFDSFRGIPPNDERHQHLDGRSVVFRSGAFRGRLAAVERTVTRFGAREVCTFHKGWFEDTLRSTLASWPHPVDVAVLDVDLRSSTRTCLREIVPRLAPGGVVFSLDGQLRATHELVADPRFWSEDVGVAAPQIHGLGRAKLLEIRPDVATRRATAVSSPWGR